MTDNNNELVWHKVLDNDELAEGRVTSVTCEHRTLCLSKQNGEYGALNMPNSAVRWVFV